MTFIPNDHTKRLFILSVALPQQRDAAGGIHVDVFRRHEKRFTGTASILFVLDVNTGLIEAQIVAKTQL